MIKRRTVPEHVQFLVMFWTIGNIVTKKVHDIYQMHRNYGVDTGYGFTAEELKCI